MNAELILFSGSSHPELAQRIADQMGLPLGRSNSHRFSNENVMVRLEDNVREKDVFVIQTSSSPVNDHLVELLIFIDAIKYASAARITAVLPYYPYCRSDKKDEPRISITARLVADLLETAGANRIITMDLHAPQIGGFSRIPVDQLLVKHQMCNYIQQKGLENLVVAAPDAGSAKRAEGFARRLDVPLVIMDKRRFADDERAHVMNIIGDVKGKNCFLIDDEVSTGGSMIEACKALRNAGAKELYAGCSHGVLSGNACERIEESPMHEFVTTNTIDQTRCSGYGKISVLSVAKLFSDAIAAIHMGTSVSKLFI